MNKKISKEPTINEEEYDVLFNWYSEWVRICKLLTTFSFGAIGFTMLILDANNGQMVPLEQIDKVKTSWLFLGLGGLLSGVSIAFAYMWLDSFSRARMPSLVGKIVFSKPFKSILKLGLGGWIVSLLAAISILIGLYFFINAVWVSL